MATYPKAYMRLTELRDQLGIPEGTLLAAYRTPGQTFAGKINPAKRNSPIVFDTACFDQWRKNQIKAAGRK